MERNEEAINSAYIRLVELISFSKMQMEKLGSLEVFNRHVLKALPEMAELIGALCEAGATKGEIAPAVEKFEGYVRGAATEETDRLFEDLKKYDAFRECVE